MENTEQAKQQTQDFTKANSSQQPKQIPSAEKEQTGGKVVSLTTQEAIEYRDYKRQKKRAEILTALSRSEGVLTGKEDAGRIIDRAMRLRQAAVRTNPTRLECARDFFSRRSVPIDCIVGGGGETLAKVKAYEAKAAVKMKAKEVTLVVSPYAVEHCRYEEIKGEIKKVLRVAKKASVKVWADKTHPRANLSRLARLCGEMGISYFCVPYFEGCEKLKMDLFGGCKLQVSEIKTLAEYKKMVAAGVGRIVTEKGWEIYNEWMQEVDKIDFPELLCVKEEEKSETQEEKGENQAKKEETPLLLPPTATLPSLPSGASSVDLEQAKRNYQMKSTELKFF